MPDDQNPFADAEVVFTYTRAQALADGVLVDVSAWARPLGFVVPVAFTAELWATLHVPPEDRALARACDVLWMASIAARRAGDAQQVPFEVTVERVRHSLLSHVGPGDDPAPVVTIGFPHDF
jgi:hypothetical protein